MNLKDEVCSAKYASRLKELGIKQDAVFLWVEVPFSYTIDKNFVKTIVSTEVKLVFAAYAAIEEKITEYAAFTIGQLFDLLPAFVDTKKDEPFNNFYLHLVKRTTKNIQYIINYYCDTHKLDQQGDPFFATMLIQHNIHDEKLPDALAKLLIELIEKGYIQIGQ